MVSASTKTGKTTTVARKAIQLAASRLGVACAALLPAGRGASGKSAWETPLTRLAVLDNGGPQPAQVLLGPGTPPVRVAIAREWIQPRWRLELTSEDGSVRVDFDEAGRSLLAVEQVARK